MKESEKIDKSLNLTKELKKLWNMKVTVIRIFVGILGTVDKSLERRLDELEIRGCLEHSKESRRLAVPQTPVKYHQLKLV